MPSSRHSATRSCAALALALLTGSFRAEAQAPVQGFATERFAPSAPGAGWLVMDSLEMHQGLGASVSVTSGYARNPMRLSMSNGSYLAVVSKQAFADLGVAVNYNQFRFYINLTNPIILHGKSGQVRGYDYTAPSVDIPGHPDVISDVRLGVDARILGEAKSRFRLGASVQVIVPSGDREDYVTDGTYRGTVRSVFAGEFQAIAYAGHLGVHIRPRNEGSVPATPQGNELLFGLAAGPRVPLGWHGSSLVIGPEFFGQSAFRPVFEKDTTGLEVLLSTRFEGPKGDASQLRIKLGTGGGINPHFGAPEWRAVFALDLTTLR